MDAQLIFHSPAFFYLLKKSEQKSNQIFFPNHELGSTRLGFWFFFWFTTVVKHKKRFKREKKRRKKQMGRVFVSAEALLERKRGFEIRNRNLLGF